MKRIIKNRAIDMPVGSYVKIYQGVMRGTGEIPSTQDAKTLECCFSHHMTKPKLTHGTGIYLIREDFTLLHLESNMDTSD